MKTKNILIAGGGTFGHIAPALGLKKTFEKIANVKVHYICASRDKRFPFYETESRVKSIPLTGLPRNKNPWKWIQFLFLFGISMTVSFFQFIKVRPKAVIATGGFVSFPYLFWGKLFRKPLFLCEQNSFPGLVNRLFAPKAQKVFLSMDDKSGRLKGKLELVGNPVLVSSCEKEDAQKILGLNLRAGKKVLGVVGGSLGAEKINQWIIENQSKLEAEGFETILSVGKKHFQAVKENNESEVLHVFDFIKNMGAFYSLCDVLICRAGASTIAELMQFEKPVIFIPYPYAAENHQLYNAQFASEYLNAEIVEEKNLDNADLISALKKLESDEKESKRQDFASSPAKIVQEVLKWI